MTYKTNSEVTTTREKIKTFSRIWHRRLGVIVGIQFLFWTIGGAYFAWFHIDNVRGHADRAIRKMTFIDKGQQYFPIHRILATSRLVSIDSIELRTWDDQLVYLFKQNKNSVEMYSAIDGKNSPPSLKKPQLKSLKLTLLPMQT